MLWDLESEMMTKGGDRIEQRRLFDAFLGSSAIWQPQPCKEHNTSTLCKPTKSSQPQDEFANENINSTSIIRNQTVPSLQRSMNPNISYGNLLNIVAPPFYSTKITNEPANVPIPESLKRTRSGNTTQLMRKESFGTITEPENKMRKKSISPEKTEDRWAGLLPDSKDFEDAIIAAALGSSQEAFKLEGNKDTWNPSKES